MKGRSARASDADRLRFQPLRARRGGERARRAQHAGVQEFDQRPQLAQMVLDRRAGQREAMVAAQQPRRLRRFGVRVLDRLRLVEDDVVRLDLAQEGGVLPQHAVGRDQEVDAREPVSQGGRARGALGADVGEDAQLRGEARRLLLPVPDQRLRHHDDRRARRFGAAARPASPGPGSSCRGPCRRPGTRRTRTGARRTASRGRPPGRGAALPETSRGAFAALTPVNWRSSSRALANCASTETSGCDASSASSRPACAGRKRRRSPSTAPISASGAYFFSHSSGSMPKLPSPRTDHGVASSQRP